MHNKPKVFLSHSSIDKPFINNLDNDLKRCQIDTWLDTIDIRHGEPWLNAIFESGIPTCDCVIVYFTPNSLLSEIVKKEIDVTIVHKLRNNYVGFLPYVASSSLRSQLRSDIQTLQVMEFNEENYNILFPQIVAEIWHIFMERNIRNVANEEKARRLEAELALEKIKGQSGIFSDSEDNDFSYIYDALDKWESVKYVVSTKNNKNKIVSSDKFVQVNLLRILPLLTAEWKYDIGKVINQLIETFVTDSGISKPDIHIIDQPKWDSILLIFGLLDRLQNTRKTSSLPPYLANIVESDHLLVYNNKLDRFRYWMAVNNKIPDKNGIREIE